MSPIPAARREAILVARQTLEARPLYLDTETTGLGPQDEVIEICLLEHDARPRLESLVRPTRPIPADTARIHGITNAEVAGAPTWADLWPQVQAILAGRVVAVYNAEFDLRLIRQSHARHRLAWEPLQGFTCLMLLYARFRGEWDPHRQDFRWQSLDQASRQCGLGLPNAHRARSDALLARALLEHMAAQAPEP